MSGKFKRIGILIAAIVITGVAATAVVMSLPKPSTNTSGSDAHDTGHIEMSGTVLCLPHKDTSGPQTMECAYGLQAEDGKYYGLKDSDPTYSNISTLAMNTKVTVSGTFKEESSAIYPTVGTIEVTNIDK